MPLFPLILGLAFCCGALLILALATPTAGRAELERRLAQLRMTPPTVTAEPEGPSWLARIGRGLTVSAATARQWEQAGRPNGWTVREFAGARALCAFTAVPLAMLTGWSLGVTPLQHGIAGIGALIAGLTAADAWLSRAAEARRAAICRALPEMLDLLVLCLDAGVGLEAAVDRAVREHAGPLAEEIRTVGDGMRLGQSREDAWRSLAARLGIPELESVAGAIGRAAALGLGLVPSLRLQAGLARERRRARLREEAARLPVRMMVPLLVCFFPALFVVLLGPSFLLLLKALAAP